MPDSRTDIIRRFVEDFGNLYASYGLKRLNGMIVGLLLSRGTPISLDDISAILGRSKGPISVAVRQLSGAGLIHRVAGPENRRDYYTADPDIFYNNHKLNMRTVRRNRMIAERALGELRSAAETADPVSDGGDAAVDARAFDDALRRMHAFYTLMESYYSGFSAAWEEVKHGGRAGEDAAEQDRRT